MTGRLTIDAGTHDQSVQSLDGPVAADELDSQPIQKLGVRGRRALQAEIVFSFHQSFAEEPCEQHLLKSLELLATS